MDTGWVVNNCERFVNSDVEQHFLLRVPSQPPPHSTYQTGLLQASFLLLSLAAISTEHCFHYFPYNCSLF